MEIKKRSNSISSIVLMLVIGGIFTALGIALTVIVIKGIVQYGISTIGAGIILPIVFILALLGFGITAIFMGGKQVYISVRNIKTMKYGKDATAQVVDSKSSSFGKNTNTRKRFALVLLYNDGEKNKKFTTDYLYDINEFRYLQRLKNLKVKIDGNFVTVCEPFPKEIYKLDSTYGIEITFYKQKPVAILLHLWRIFFFIALALLIVSMIVGNSVFTKAAIITIFAVNFPFVIPLAIFLIKWIHRKK